MVRSIKNSCQKDDKKMFFKYYSPIYWRELCSSVLPFLYGKKIQTSNELRDFLNRIWNKTWKWLARICFQYWYILPQHYRVLFKRTSILTVISFNHKTFLKKNGSVELLHTAININAQWPNDHWSEGKMQVSQQLLFKFFFCVLW